MQVKRKQKLAVDAAMTAALLLLMAYGLVGEAAHEWLGVGVFILFLTHHVLNRKWLLAIGTGKYTPPRIVQTALVGVILLCMLGSMVSGILLSRYVFTFLPKRGGYEAAQKAHILCAYWGFVCMGLHLGLHWSMMLTMVRKHLQPSPPRTRYLRLIGWLWALYGAFAFHRRGVGLYLLLKSHFMFYDDSESVIFFLISEIRANRKRATCWLCSLQKVIRTGGNKDSACFCPYFSPNG